LSFCVIRLPLLCTDHWPFRTSRFRRPRTTGTMRLPGWPAKITPCQRDCALKWTQSSRGRDSVISVPMVKPGSQ
jgi:hypothetical protein